MKRARRGVATAILVCLPPALIAAPPGTNAPPIAVTATPIGIFHLDRPPRQGGIALGVAPAGTLRLLKDGAEVQVARDGHFLIAFGRDHAPQALIGAVLGDGRIVTERVAVRSSAWRVESLRSVPHHSQPDADFLARRPAELAQITAARTAANAIDGWRQHFVWPARGRISGLFGAQRIYAGTPGAPHNGVDVAAGAGATVVSPADGVVTLAAASPFTLEGNLLMLDHGMGLNSAFLHLSRIDVRVGDHIRQGQPIGAVGMTGRASGPHLHWSMMWQTERIDPLLVAGPMGVR